MRQLEAGRWIRTPRYLQFGNMEEWNISCKAVFDPRRLAAVVIDGWTGEKRLVYGGATSRFAVVVDCGKAMVKWRSVGAEPALVSLLADCLQCEVEQIGVGH